MRNRARLTVANTTKMTKLVTSASVVSGTARDGTMPADHEFAQRNPDKYLYMHKHVIPELEKMGVSQETIEMLFVENPKRFLSGS